MAQAGSETCSTITDAKRRAVRPTGDPARNENAQSPATGASHNLRMLLHDVCDIGMPGMVNRKDLPQPPARGPILAQMIKYGEISGNSSGSGFREREQVWWKPTERPVVRRDPPDPPYEGGNAIRGCVQSAPAVGSE